MKQDIAIFEDYKQKLTIQKQTKLVFITKRSKTVSESFVLRQRNKALLGYERNSTE